MLRFLLKLSLVLLPLIPFAYGAHIVMEWLSSGETLHGIALLLGLLAALALIEGILFRCWILPSWGQLLSERLYGGSYFPEDDELAQLATRIRRSEDTSLLPELHRLVLRQRKRARGWLELARLHQDIAKDENTAVQVLLEGADSVSDPEERAMFLYRAGAMAATELHSPAKAAEYFTRAATSFPNTTYGKHAAARAGK